MASTTVTRWAIRLNPGQKPARYYAHAKSVILSKADFFKARTEPVYSGDTAMTGEQAALQSINYSRQYHPEMLANAVAEEVTLPTPSDTAILKQLPSTIHQITTYLNCDELWLEEQILRLMEEGRLRKDTTHAAGRYGYVVWEAVQDRLPLPNIHSDTNIARTTRWLMHLGKKPTEQTEVIKKFFENSKPRPALQDGYTYSQDTKQLPREFFGRTDLFERKQAKHGNAKRKQLYWIYVGPDMQAWCDRMDPTDVGPALRYWEDRLMADDPEAPAWMKALCQAGRR